MDNLIQPESSDELKKFDCHPDFSDETSDIYVVARDCQMVFRTHSYVLKTTSGFFRATIELRNSRPADNGESNNLPFYTNIEAVVLEHLMRMVSGLPLLPLTVDLIEPILDAADSLEMPGPKTIIRSAIMNTSFAKDALRMYVVCRRQDWVPELKHYSKLSLEHDLHDPKHYEILRNLPGYALLDLFALHRGRREKLWKQLNDPPFVSGGAAVCIQCQGRIEYQTWRELKYKIILEVDKRPLGDTIMAGLSEWPEAIACWEAICPGAGCLRRLYDKAETYRAIRECVESLPVSCDRDCVRPD